MAQVMFTKINDLILSRTWQKYNCLTVVLEFS